MATVITSTFELVGADGGPLRGDVRTAAGGADRPAVVICHGFKGFKNWGFFPKLADRLAHAGMTAVSFDFTGSGVGPDGESFSEPQRFAHATFSQDLADIAIVVGATLGGDLADTVAAPGKLGLFGHSRGGGMAAVHAADNGTVAALVTWAAIGTVRRWPDAVVAQWRQDGKIDVTNARTGDVLPLYEDVLDDMEAHRDGKLDLRRAASHVGMPWLIIHGEADETVPLSEAESLHEAAGSNARLHVVAGGGHTLGAGHPWSGSTAELDGAMAETVGWFAKYLF